MSAEILSLVPEVLAAHGVAVLATVVDAVGSTPRGRAARMLFLPSGEERGTIGGGRFESLVRADAHRLLTAGGLPETREYSFTPEEFGAVCGGRATVLLERLESPARLLIVGAGHCGRALARAAAFSGYAVTVADDRASELAPEAFPQGVTLVHLTPDHANLPLDAAHVALVSRGHATDGLALRRLRGVPLAYLGMIGSRAKRKALFDELRAEGFTEEDLARISCPIGLAIGAETPEEIAISILAELIAKRRKV